jgi:anti-sigma factor RsiW
MNYRKWLSWPATTCSSNQQLLSAFIDAELDPAQLKVLRSHLSECVECRSKVDRLRFAKASLAKLRIPTVYAGTFETERMSDASRAGDDNLFSRVWNLRIPIPVPVVAGIVVLTLAATFRQHSSSVTKPESLSNRPQAVVVNKVVEVPVERVRTRIVYVDRVKPALRRADSVAKLSGGPRRWLATNDLGNFRPTSNINLRIVKEPEQ